MIAIYCAKDKRKEVEKRMEEPYRLYSPQNTEVDHSVTHVIIVGDHQHIEERYAGIASVEYMDVGGTTSNETTDEDE